MIEMASFYFAIVFDGKNIVSFEYTPPNEKEKTSAKMFTTDNGFSLGYL